MRIDTSNLTIRPFEPTDLDYAAMVKLVNQDWPNNLSSVKGWKYNDSKRNPKHLYRRYIGEIEIESGKQIVAVGFVNKRGLTNVPGKYFIKYYIDKAFKGQGLDEPLYTHMVTDLADKNPIELKTETRDDNTERIELFQQKGFQQRRKPKRYFELDVSNFKSGLFPKYTEKLAASGIRIVTLQELEKKDSNWMQKLYDLEITIKKEILDPNEFKPIGLDEYAKMFKAVNFRADASFVALDDNNYIGISSLWPDLVRKDLLFVGTTSVLPSYRNRGIATALKIKTIEFAEAYGANAIQTRTVENSPMHVLNMKLGFKPGLKLLFFEKVL